MKTRIKSLLSILIIVTGFLACDTTEPLSTVASVDLVRYSGTWYEIADYPQIFEKGCSNVKATYTPKSGYIEVFNQCIKNGKPNNIKGKAFIVHNSGNAKLKVQFFWPFKGDYWIIDMAEDYTWAIVSNSKMSSLWILSRAPKMDQILYDSLIDKLVKLGFQKDKIVLMVQE